MPQIDSDLAELDDKSLDEIRQKRLERERAGTEKPPHPERVRLRNLQLAQYAPPFLRERLEMDENIFMANPIEGMSKSAARGIKEALDVGYFATPEGEIAWRATFSQIWSRVVAVIRKT